MTLNPSPINFLMNDPTTSRLMEPVPYNPPNEQMPFMVVGFDGGGVPWDSYAGRAGICYCILNEAIPVFLNNLGRPCTWSSTQTLIVQPAAGFQFNAYYDRRSLMFFFDHDPIRNKLVFAASSGDVIAHELGHAFLDAIRPDFWNLGSFEVAAFHESFGDIHAMTTGALQDRFMNRVMVETEGDISRPNTLSRIAEELGCAVYRIPDGIQGCLRDAINEFQYQVPETLPRAGGPEMLVYEPHSFSRIMTGAIYDVLAGIYKYHILRNVTGLEAFRTAGKVVSLYMIKACEVVQAQGSFFQNFAAAFLAQDQNHGGEYYNMIKGIFERRKMIPMATSLPTVEKRVRLADRVSGDNPLYHVFVSVPGIEGIVEDGPEEINKIKFYLDHLHESGKVGEGKEFQVVNGSLIRNHI